MIKDVSYRYVCILNAVYIYHSRAESWLWKWIFFLTTAVKSFIQISSDFFLCFSHFLYVTLCSNTFHLKGAAPEHQVFETYHYSDTPINVTLKHIFVCFFQPLLLTCFSIFSCLSPFLLLPLFVCHASVSHIWGRRDRGRGGEDACRPMEGLRLRHHSGPSGAILRA